MYWGRKDSVEAGRASEVEVEVEVGGGGGVVGNVGACISVDTYCV